MADTDQTVRTLKQVDRDLMTARELVRAAIKTEGKTVATAVIVSRLEAALESLKTLQAGA